MARCKAGIICWGDVFTVADLNVASVLAWAVRAKMDFSSLPTVAKMLRGCLTQTAARKRLPNWVAHHAML